MKTTTILSIALPLFLFSSPAKATVDYEDTINLVTTELQSGEYRVIKVPFIGCMGIPIYCTVDMFTFDYKIPTGGCGQEFQQIQSINALACAKFSPTIIDAEKKAEDGSTYFVEEVSKATVDLTGCEESLNQNIFNEYNSEEEKRMKITNLKASIKKAFDGNFPTAKALFIKYKGKDL